MLVIAFLVTVGLSVGRQLVDWWRTDPESTMPDLSNLNGVDLDWNRTPVTLRFGDAPTAIERVPFTGDRRQLDDELTKIGQSLVTTGEPPTVPLTEAERDWLAALQTAPPVLWDSTRGNVYRRHEPLPSFVATRFVERSSREDAANEIGQRIVGWGLAFPSETGEWTIYVFHPESAGAAGESSVDDIPLPSGARNITNLRGAGGSRWFVFQGRGDLAGWVQHFDNQLGGENLVSRTVGTQTASVKYRRDRSVFDVQIRRDANGALSGVVWSAEAK
jgi:hypothetical protein